jgi:hypothetical protein
MDAQMTAGERAVARTAGETEASMLTFESCQLWMHGRLKKLQ